MSRVRARARRVFLVSTVGVLASCSGGGKSHARITALPRAYVVTYRVTQNGTPHWEVLTVNRRFGGSDVTYDSADAPRGNDPPASGTISTDLALFSVDGTTVRMVGGRQPGPASGDQYL